MRDILIVGIVIWGALAALKRPWIGVLVWTWLSIMNPHRYAYGFAYSAPLAQITALSVLLGLIFTKDKASPFVGAPVTWFFVFCCWFTVSWLLGLDVGGDFDQWMKVVKINVMIFIALALIRSKEQILGLAAVLVASLALLGAKGGVYTILTGGGGRVWGPPGSFIADNNEFALALVMTIPLLRFLQLQVQSKWMRGLLLLVMILCAISALGSQSRGALLAISAMGFFFWLKSKNKLPIGIGILVVGICLVAFMPDTWTDRMGTIKTYDEDKSAMGRISAWWMAWNLAWHYPFGIGFNAVRPELFALYSPYPDMVQAAHSIYFQIIGHHGFIGFFLFIGIFFSTWRCTNWVIKERERIPETQWCEDLAVMCQVSLLAYFVGGSFLSLAYFDFPYNIMVLVVAVCAWLRRRAYETESSAPPKWIKWFGFRSETGLRK